MKFLRTLFVLLLCAMLPLSGLAAGRLAGQCPMQAALADDGSAMPAAMSDCESTTPASGEPGKSKGFLCKIMAQCQTDSVYHPVSTPTVARPSGPVFPFSFQYAESLSIRAPDALWRPPQTI